jgi:hypothetical protein
MPILTDEQHEASASGSCDYESYWNAVLGSNRDADDVCREFGLIGRDGLDEWLGTAESEARAVSTDGFPSREDCERWHNEALDELTEASGGLDALTADQAWEKFVGSQSTSGFIDASGDPSEYVEHSPLCSGLSQAERESLAEKLAERIAQS